MEDNFGAGLDAVEKGKTYVPDKNWILVSQLLIQLLSYPESYKEIIIIKQIKW
jgi:hypothetical protein